MSHGIYRNAEQGYTPYLGYITIAGGDAHEVLSLTSSGQWLLYFPMFHMQHRHQNQNKDPIKWKK